MSPPDGPAGTGPIRIPAAPSGVTGESPEHWDDGRCLLPWWRAAAWWVVSSWWQFEYAIRPYDMLADRRRWFWQPRTRCGWPL